ncbi:MAG: DegT/DnrJ/EryC1/StrS family aminotransferase [Phycisphaeraceae bacterium]|nr:DegT/DnrJ/EryC1/StrS family aminotransferase [Phycisphaeraceae bacterium]
MSTHADRPIDMRSDTVTRPTRAMRQAMADADVGDDVLGDDPTVIKLQERIAAMMGKEAAVFVPSGTMANQTAIRAHCESGDEVICHENGHIIHYETGSPAALSGVMVKGLSGRHGLFTAHDVEAAFRPRSHHFSWSKLVIVENTNNRGGGTIWPLAQAEAVANKAHELGLRAHLDGARIWNASVATGIPVGTWARSFDTISCCFSKGLGAPVGSAVAGSKELITRVHRFRKMFGGTMRQSGILAAAALHALDHHVDRLADDHAAAKKLADALAHTPGISVDMEAVQTNMVFFDVDPSLGTAAQFCDRLKAAGLWVLASGPQRIRSVLHLDVAKPDVDRAISIIASCAKTASAAA